MNTNSFSDLDDSSLTVLLQQGYEQAFKQIYERYKGVLYLHAVKMLKDRDEAQDVVQEIFTKLWDKRETIIINTTLSAYLYTAIRNKILDIFSHEKVVATHQQSLQDFINQGEYQTDNYMLEKELIVLIEKEISALPTKMKEVFELSRRKNLSYSQIAEQLDISENTVRKHISKALSRLRSKLTFILIIFAIVLKYVTQ
ncbi:RNA polymerase sigma-70 factor [Pedobacter glucosidilyticus]|uniref:RNA polymerase sigma-70 factor n=1 Tax=Pedobacter glucosidilyticus TaxID=1122941 RepID=UPI00047ED72C|nr:RNA polymerase sigma-70 factor [Pedobacter glucosidilyticus]